MKLFWLMFKVFLVTLFITIGLGGFIVINRKPKNIPERVCIAIAIVCYTSGFMTVISGLYCAVYKILYAAHVVPLIH